MATATPDLAALADKLEQAQASLKPCGKLTDIASLTAADAYRIQSLNVEKRLTKGLHGRASRVVGHKVGLTSEAIQSWLQVDVPDFGHLTDDMIVDDGDTAPRDVLLQPRAEGEIAFVLGRDLAGPGLSTADVVRATEFVVPSIEIIDSRIADWKISYEDTVADNASSGLFVLGNQKTSLDDLDLELCGMALRKNGVVVSTGCGAACLAHPARAVAWLANTLGAFGQRLEAGHIVLSGALGPAIPAKLGDTFEVEIAGLGRCAFSMPPLPA